MSMKKTVEIVKDWLASDTVRQYLQSSAWMVLARAMWVVMAFTVGIVVIRRLGPHDLGVLNYVVAYVGIISVIASLGLDAIVERQLAHHPENEGRILGNYFVFKLLSTAAMLAVLGASFVFIPERRLIVGCLEVALGHFCQPFGVVQCFFFVTVQNRYNAWSQLGCCLIYNAIRLYAALTGKTLRPDATAKNIAETEGVDIRLYNVIYKAIEDVEAAMKGMLDPVFEEKVLGHAEIRQIFKASGVGNIAGSYVLDGTFERGCMVRITHDGEQIFEGNLASLKRFKDDVKEVKAGFECGLVFEDFNDFEELDVVEAYKMVEVPR